LKAGLKYTLGIFFIGVCCYSQTQSHNFFKPSDSLNKSRRNAVIISEATLAGITLVGLDQLWYKDYPRSKFHTLNDNNEWLQMDKLGHVFSSYQLGKVGSDVLKWSGVSKKNQLIYGATLGFTFLTAVEVFDGFSNEWGFSWGDMIANTAGMGMYVGQELLWKEQRILLKFSFHQTRFAAERPDMLGNGILEEILKDYNGQTYWLSFNVHSFFKQSKMPKWFNIAIGYGAEGMLTGENSDVNNIFINQQRQRQLYLSFDVDLSRIKTNSHFLRTIFDVFNMIKVPFPTLEFNDRIGIKLHGIYF